MGEDSQKFLYPFVLQLKKGKNIIDPVNLRGKVLFQ